MKFSEILELLNIVIPAFLGIVSIAIAYVAIRQSNKSIKLTEESIEDANRPYVVAYLTSMQVTNTIIEYVVIKNFGQTGATINSIQVIPDYEYEGHDLNNGNPFKDINNHFIAPGQSLTFIVGAGGNDYISVPDRTIRINYKTANKTYSEDFHFNETSISSSILHAKADPSQVSKDTKLLIRAFQELIRQKL